MVSGVEGARLRAASLVTQYEAPLAADSDGDSEIPTGDLWAAGAAAVDTMAVMGIAADTATGWASWAIPVITIRIITIRTITALTVTDTQRMATTVSR